MKSDIDVKVDSLLALMTLEEKIGQLNLYNGSWEFTGPVPADDYNQNRAENIKKGKVGGLLNVIGADATRAAQRMAVEESRLGIPLLFGYDVIHGFKTMFPIPLAQAASWDAEVARKGAAISAKEAASAGINWTFSPMIDISRDARWGRIMESAGEDPYLTGIMTKAWIEGYQGNDLSDDYSIAACAKHFAAYGFAESGLDYNTVEISDNTLFNVVLPPFEIAAKSGVATFMNAFNEINGVPATGHVKLQREILKGKWNFQGFMVSDWASINEMVTHGFSENPKAAGLAAITAGCDMDMESRIYESQLEELLKEGKISISLIDDAVRRILRVKFQLGLFENPYKYCDIIREKQNMLTASHLDEARDAARKAIVLLKNEKNILPLSKNLKSVAVIGQVGGSRDIPLGSWRAQAIENSGVSVLDGIRSALGKSVDVSFTYGYQISTGKRSFIHNLTFLPEDKSGFTEAIRLASKSELVVFVMGEDCYQTGEGRSQADIGLRANQEELLAELLKVNKNIVVVLMTGRPVAIPFTMKQAPAVMQAWYGGSQAGHAIADVLFGEFNPSGRLPVSFPQHSGQEPLYYNKKNTGRPTTNDFDDGLVFWSHYTDIPNEPLLPFGFGLSYTQFAYSDFQVKTEKGKIQVTVKIENTGKFEGKETVQLYIRDVSASLIQPIKRLVGYKQINLSPGAVETISFTLTGEELGFYNLNYDWVTEDGDFIVMVGANSRDLMSKTVNVKF